MQADFTFLSAFLLSPLFLVLSLCVADWAVALQTGWTVALVAPLCFWPSSTDPLLPEHMEMALTAASLPLYHLSRRDCQTISFSTSVLCFSLSLSLSLSLFLSLFPFTVLSIFLSVSDCWTKLMLGFPPSLWLAVWGSVGTYYKGLHVTGSDRALAHLGQSKGNKQALRSGWVCISVVCICVCVCVCVCVFVCE